MWKQKIIFPKVALQKIFETGGAPLCSIERGQSNNKEAENIMGNSFIMLIYVAILFIVLGLFFKKSMLYLFAASHNTFSYANEYIPIYLLETVFVMISSGMNPFINAQGFGRIGMLTVVLGAIVNMILDPIFIFVFYLRKNYDYYRLYS